LGSAECWVIEKDMSRSFSYVITSQNRRGDYTEYKGQHQRRMPPFVLRFIKGFASS
jgi:hypothetical protein